MQKFLERFMPFLVMGVALVVGIIGLFLLSYLLIWGALVAVILYFIAWIGEKIKGKSNKVKKEAHKGRTIEHE